MKNSLKMNFSNKNNDKTRIFAKKFAKYSKIAYKRFIFGGTECIASSANGRVQRAVERHEVAVACAQLFDKPLFSQQQQKHSSCYTLKQTYEWIEIGSICRTLSLKHTVAILFVDFVD